eukprot:sb/3476061/
MIAWRIPEVCAKFQQTSTSNIKIQTVSITEIVSTLISIPLILSFFALGFHQRWWYIQSDPDLPDPDLPVLSVQSDLYLTALYLAAPLFNGRIFFPQKILTKISEKFQNLCFLSPGLSRDY